MQSNVAVRWDDLACAKLERTDMIFGSRTHKVTSPRAVTVFEMFPKLQQLKTVLSTSLLEMEQVLSFESEQSLHAGVKTEI